MKFGCVEGKAICNLQCQWYVNFLEIMKNHENIMSALSVVISLFLMCEQSRYVSCVTFGVFLDVHCSMWY